MCTVAGTASPAGVFGYEARGQNRRLVPQGPPSHESQLGKEERDDS